MSISIGLIILIFIILINFIFSLCKQKIFYICYMVVSFILGVTGGVWTIMLPKRLSIHLFNHMVNERLDEAFVIWTLDKFKRYAVRSLLASMLIILICSCILFIADIKKENKAWYAIGYIVNVYRFALIIVGLLYSYNLINKRFDLASYIMDITLAECLLLYVPLLLKKKLSWNRGIR